MAVANRTGTALAQLGQPHGNGAGPIGPIGCKYKNSKQGFSLFMLGYLLPLMCAFVGAVVCRSHFVLGFARRTKHFLLWQTRSSSSSQGHYSHL
jgi:hypothetical protein